MASESHADYHQTACAFSSSTDDQLIAQLEFYFSQDNLIQDHYLRSQMDDENFVPILTICNFSKVKTFIENISDPEQFIANLVQSKSDVLQVCDLGLKIRAQSGPLKYRLVVRDVPINYNREDVLEMFKTLPEAKVLSAEPTGCNSTWYIGFENENHSHAAMEHLKAEYNLKVHMKKVVGHPVSSRPAAQPAWPYGNVGPVFQPASPPVQQQTWTYLPNSQNSSNANSVQTSNRPDEYQNFGAGNWTHLIRNPQAVRGRNKNINRQMPQFSRTMYQPFNRRGFGVAESGSNPEVANPNTNQGSVQGHFKSYPNSNGKVHPKRRSPRPHRDHNGNLAKSYERKKPIGGSSTPDSDKTSSPILADPVPATPFELKQIEFPTLSVKVSGPIATDSPTPPPPNSKEIFDDLKPANNKLADVLRTGASPEPSLSKNQNPIAPPTQPPKTPKNKEKTREPVPMNPIASVSWVPSSSRSIVETIKKDKNPERAQNQNQTQQTTPPGNSKASSKQNSEKIKLHEKNSNSEIVVTNRTCETVAATTPTETTKIKNTNMENQDSRTQKSDEENNNEDEGWIEVSEKPKRNPKNQKSEKTFSEQNRTSRGDGPIRSGSRDYPSNSRRERKNPENRKRKDFQRIKQKSIPESDPPADLNGESFGPSLVSGSKLQFPVAAPVPLIPSSRWADVVTSK